MSGIFDCFSPAKPDKASDEAITVTLPLKWSDQGLRSADGQLIGIPETPDDIHVEDQVKFSCLWARMAYDPKKRRTLLRAMNATLELSGEHKMLPRVCFEVYSHEFDDHLHIDNGEEPIECQRPSNEDSVHHVFEEEPKLPRDHESTYVNGHLHKAAQTMLDDWIKTYGNGALFHKMKFTDFKRGLDLTYGNSRHVLRFDLWDCITAHYLHCHQNRLTASELAYIRGRRSDITKRFNNGAKLMQQVPNPKRTRSNR